MRVPGQGAGPKRHGVCRNSRTAGSEIRQDKLAWPTDLPEVELEVETGGLDPGIGGLRNKTTADRLPKHRLSASLAQADRRAWSFVIPTRGNDAGSSATHPRCGESALRVVA
jgi:hypothetical protein